MNDNDGGDAVRQPEILTLGLDIGYGAVKAVTGETALVFPSVCGHARDIKFQQDEIAARHPGDQLRDEMGTWFVGDLALTQLPPGELLRLRGRTADEATLGNVFRVRLAKTAIGKLWPGRIGATYSICGWQQACQSITCPTRQN